MRPDSLPRLWRYINLLLTYLLTTVRLRFYLESVVDTRNPSVRPSVCHTGGSVKKVEVRIVQFSPHTGLR